MTAAVARHSQDYGMAMEENSLGHGTLHQSQQDYEQMVLNSNKEGMDFLRKGQYKQAFEQLKYAEAVVVAKQGEDEPTNLMSVTCNNLGCYYKKVGKLHAALSYLRKALKIEVSLQTDDVTVAGTHLNVCAILSKLDKHDKALQHAQCALELISSRVAASGDAASQDEYSVLAIAYHNVAVERDYLHQLEEAAAAYQQGHQVAKKCLGEQHPLTQTLGKNADAALQKSHQQASKQAAVPVASAAGNTSRQRKSMEKESSQSAASQAHVLPEIAATSSGKSKESANQRLQQQRTSEEAEVLQQDAGADWDRGFQGGAARGGTLPPLQTAPSYGHYAAPGFQSGMPMYSARGLHQQQQQQQQQQVYDGPMDPTPPPQQKSHPPAVATPSFFDTMGSDVAKPPSPPPLFMDSRTARPVKAEPPSAGPALAEATPPRSRPNRDKAPSAPVMAPPVPADSSRGGRPPRGPRDPAATSAAAAARAQRDLARNGGKAPAAPVSWRDQAVVPIPQQSQLLRKSAAEKIQRFWREYHRGHVDGRDRTRRESECATRIQARWRAFSVRRRKLNGACIAIQRWVRGFLVRLAIRRHKAAVVIQRYAIGMITRRNVREAVKASVAIQKQARARQAKAQVQARREAIAKSTRTIKGCIRSWACRGILQQLRAERDSDQARSSAVKTIQSVFRGGQSRQEVAKKRAVARARESKKAAATVIQAAVRARNAKKRVAALRQTRLKIMSDAATFVRKIWLGHMHRRRYLELRQEFLKHENSVVTLQRYIRGYVVRLRMWRNAIRAEEELWGAVEIQRCWRGYLGRLRWELEYEAVFSREQAAYRIQRFVRGWLARTKVHRRRKRLARAEFEKARRRFKSAQKIQALVRGMLCRKKMSAFRARKVEAATTVQRIFRGHRLRCKNWEQDYLKQTVKIQSSIRTYLVRCRRFHLIAKVIMIQRNWRRWIRFIPEAERRRRSTRWRQDREAARTIQHGYRESKRHAEESSG